MKSLRLLLAVVLVFAFTVAPGWSQKKHEAKTPPPTVSLICIIAKLPPRASCPLLPTAAEMGHRAISTPIRLSSLGDAADIR